MGDVLWFIPTAKLFKVIYHFMIGYFLLSQDWFERKMDFNFIILIHSNIIFLNQKLNVFKEEILAYWSQGFMEIIRRNNSNFLDNRERNSFIVEWIYFSSFWQTPRLIYFFKFNDIFMVYRSDLVDLRSRQYFIHF